jgi:hypothetical protein
MSTDENYEMGSEQDVCGSVGSLIGTRISAEQKNIISEKAIKLPRR